MAVDSAGERLRNGLRGVRSRTMRIVLAFLVVGVACGDDDGAPLDAGRDAAVALDAGDRPDASALDASFDAGAEDAAADVDAGPVDAGPVDAGPVDAGPVDAGPPIPCAFNRECPESMFCDSDACEEGCFCALGARGTGGLGDACTSGNDCASSICLEGPGDALVCSIECTESECDTPLPLCTDVAFVGRICVRDPG